MSFGLDLFSAKTDDEGDFLSIVSYKKMANVTYEDIERMENYYDCSCEVIRVFMVNYVQTKVSIFLFSNDVRSYAFLKLSPYYMQVSK